MKPLNAYQLTLVLSWINAVLAFGGVIMTLWGTYHFKSGLVAKTLRRGQPAAFLLFIYFFVFALAGYDVGPSVGIEDILVTAFMLAITYATYGFISDWTHLERLKL